MTERSSPGDAKGRQHEPSYPGYRGKTCSGTTRRGTPCRAPAMANGLCSVHGGYIPSGSKSPLFKHGRYSRHLGPALAPFWEAALADPERLAIDSELALLDVRLAQLVKSLEGPEKEGTWQQLVAAFRDWERAQTLPGPAAARVLKMSEAMQRIEALIEAGGDVARTWDEIRAMIQERRVLLESLDKRQLASGKAIPTDQVMSLIAALARMISEEVTDPEVRLRINDRIQAVLAGRRLALTQELP